MPVHILLVPLLLLFPLQATFLFLLFPHPKLVAVHSIIHAIIHATLGQKEEKKMKKKLWEYLQTCWSEGILQSAASPFPPRSFSHERAAAQMLKNWPYFGNVCHKWLHSGDNKVRVWANMERKQGLTLANTENQSVFIEVRCVFRQHLNVDDAPSAPHPADGRGGGVLLFHLWHDSLSTWVLSRGQREPLIHHYEKLLLI